MSSPITIRLWEPRDRVAVQELLSLLAADALLVADDSPTHVAAVGDQIVGMVTLCMLTTLTGRKAFVDHLVVARDWRRRGVARLLMWHAIEVASAAGASRIDLSANDSKVAARALYRLLGFQERETGSFRLTIRSARPASGR